MRKHILLGLVILMVMSFVPLTGYIEVPVEALVSHYQVASLEHYHIGVAPSCATYYATCVQVSIRTPSGPPQSSDPDPRVVLVGISVWDIIAGEHNSYDQLGFTSSAGAWQLILSWTTWDEGVLDYHGDCGPCLSFNTLYTFKMTVSQETVTFEVKQGSTSVWLQTRGTGGVRFCIDLGFTLYEEIVHNPSDPFIPAYDFKFENTYVDGVRFDSWKKFYAGSSPPPAPVYIDSYWHYVFIRNTVLGGGGGGGGGKPLPQ